MVKTVVRALSLGLLSTLIGSMGCSSATDEPASAQDDVITDVVPDAVDEGAGAVSPLDLNPCACPDLSQIKDCRSGVCYSYCKDARYQDPPKPGCSNRCWKWVRYRSGTTPPSACRY